MRNRYSLHKIMMVGLFVTMLFFPYVTKTVHIHYCVEHIEQGEDAEHDHEHQQHDCKHCMLCNFSFYSFTTPENINLTVSITYLLTEPITEQKEGYDCFLSTNYTRGPPSKG